MSIIKLRDINKTYYGAQPLHVLKGINLDIDEGEFVSIMGASGSGKSTLLNILGILDNYDSGEYMLAGTLIKDLSEKRAAEYRNHLIGFIFQSFNLIAFKSAVENVELPLFYQGVGRKKRHSMAMEYLDRLGLAQWANHYPNELSGGQKQRVAIARAMALDPDVIVCDEAVSALDVLVQDQVLRLLNDLQAEKGLSYLFITHDLAVVRQIADEVVVMQHGKLVEHATTDEVFDHPKKQYTRDLLDAIPGGKLQLGLD